MPEVKPRRVALIGAPADVGAAKRGSSMGPEALRVAGLHEALERLGCEVVDHGNVSGPIRRPAAPIGGYRHLDDVVAWAAAVRDAVGLALDAGEVPIVMGGDHSLAVGSVAAVAARVEGPLTVLWLDAHSDFNTPESSPSGNLHGMPAAVLAGHGPAPLLGLMARTPVVDPAGLIEIGVRSVDAVERRLVLDDGVTVFDMRDIDERGMRAVMEDALTAAARRGGHLHVSLDVDFLDPSIAPGVGTPVPGGPTYREAQLCMEMIYDARLLGSLDVMELDPSRDVRNTTAALVVELIASLFGQQILARPPAQRTEPHP